MVTERCKTRDARRAARISALGLLKGGDCVPSERSSQVFQRLREAWSLEKTMMVSPDDEFEMKSIDLSAQLQSTAPMLYESLTAQWPDAVKVLLQAVEYDQTKDQRRDQRWESQ